MMPPPPLTIGLEIVSVTVPVPPPPPLPLKVAPHVFGAFIVVVPLGAQSPVHPANVYPAAGWAVMTGYRVGFLGAGVIALLGALSSFLVPAARTDYRPSSGVVAQASRQSQRGNDHHYHER